MRKIILISLCMILVAGCGKKQPQVQKPQQSSTETQPIVTMKEIQTKKQPPQQLYPVMAEKSRKIPLWVNEMISVYNTNYDAWREKSSTDTSSVLISSLTSQGFTPSAPSAPVSVPTTPQLSHSTGLPGTEKPSSIIRGPMASTQGSSQTRISTSPQSSATQSPVEPEKPDSSGETTPQPPQPQPQVAGVDIVRTIQNTAEGAYVRLNVNVKDTRVNGIIVTENLPDNYTLVSASPSVSKRTGNSIKWLFYGTSLTSQVINYEIKGSGRASISGSFSSTLGSGTTTGDSQLGQ